MSTKLNQITQELTEDQLEQALLKKREDKAKAQAKKRKEFEDSKEAFVSKTVNNFIEVQSILTQLKEDSVLEGNKLWVQMFELQGAEPKEQKQFSLTNKQKNLKVTVERAERMGFSEEALVGIQGVKEYFYNKFSHRSKEAYELLDDILAKNGKGDYDPKLLSKLRARVRKINDPKLSKHFATIEENQTVVGTALYLRAFKKDKMDKWQDITLQFSSL